MANIFKKTLHFFIYNVCLFFIIDGMLSWFTPKWRKRGHIAYKIGKKYLNYRYDLLSEEQIDHLKEATNDLKESLKTFNKERISASTGKLEHMVNAVPGPSTRNALGENVEAFFVILVIFLGLRAYVVQPFRIPTGSMQPSLNGIVIHDYDEEPSLLGKGIDLVRYGSSYVHEEATDHMSIVSYKGGTKLLLLTRTTVFFNNGKQIDIPCAENEVVNYFKRTFGTATPSFRPGDTIMKARIDAGDLILVNKMAYHFRQPKLGETFVFDTRGIDGINSRASSDQAGGTHYVKRLCGLPGTTVEIKNPYLYIDGQIPDSTSIKRVTDRLAPYNKYGYVAISANQQALPSFVEQRQRIRLLKNDTTPALNQYCAFGDNTTNSFDSRYWGPVNQYNVIGPASFSLWPFTSHWGDIP